MFLNFFLTCISNRCQTKDIEITTHLSIPGVSSVISLPLSKCPSKRHHRSVSKLLGQLVPLRSPQERNAQNLKHAECQIYIN